MNITDRHYVSHLKNVFSVDVLRDLRNSIERTDLEDDLSERDAAAVSRGEKPVAIRLNPLWYRVWTTVDDSLIETVAPFSLISYPPQVRQIRSASQEVRWHQDAGFVKAMNRPHRQILTVFLPLDDRPESRCTLQFTHEKPPFLDHAPTSNGFAAGLDRGFSDVYHFDLSLGDCLVFGDLVPHRTFAPPGTTWERTSFEFRAVTPADMLGDKDYFDLRLRTFVQRDKPSALALPAQTD